MSTQEISNRNVKALAIAQVLFKAGIGYRAAMKVGIAQGPFWSAVVQKTGREVREGAEPLSIETKREALYFLAAMSFAKERKGLRRVRWNAS